MKRANETILFLDFFFFLLSYRKIWVAGCVEIVVVSVECVQSQFFLMEELVSLFLSVTLPFSARTKI